MCFGESLGATERSFVGFATPTYWTVGRPTVYHYELRPEGWEWNRDSEFEHPLIPPPDKGRHVTGSCQILAPSKVKSSWSTSARGPSKVKLTPVAESNLNLLCPFATWFVLTRDIFRQMRRRNATWSSFKFLPFTNSSYLANFKSYIPNLKFAEGHTKFSLVNLKCISSYFKALEVHVKSLQVTWSSCQVTSSHSKVTSIRLKLLPFGSSNFDQLGT